MFLSVLLDTMRLKLINQLHSFCSLGGTYWFCLLIIIDFAQFKKNNYLRGLAASNE